jgi:hypothetical protein
MTGSRHAIIIIITHGLYHPKCLGPVCASISLPINQHIKMRAIFAHSISHAAYTAEIERALSALGKKTEINIFRDFGCRFELARLFFCLSGSECVCARAQSESRGRDAVYMPSQRRDANGNGGALTWNCDQNSLGNKEVQRCWILKKCARGEKRNPRAHALQQSISASL